MQYTEAAGEEHVRMAFGTLQTATNTASWVQLQGDTNRTEATGYRQDRKNLPPATAYALQVPRSNLPGPYLFTPQKMRPTPMMIYPPLQPMELDARGWEWWTGGLLLHGALGGEALRGSLGVGAVVVDHVLALHPAHALLQGEVELVVLPVAGGGGGAAAGLSAGDGDAGVGPEAPVGGGEGRVGPVRLDAPALRGPVVGVP